jgi:hypothetical protein
MNEKKNQKGNKFSRRLKQVEVKESYEPLEANKGPKKRSLNYFD